MARKARNILKSVILSDAVVGIGERSSDPADPPEGQCVIWLSDGTGTGDDGDLMCAITAGGTTATGILLNYSDL